MDPSLGNSLAGGYLLLVNVIPLSGAQVRLDLQNGAYALYRVGLMRCSSFLSIGLSPELSAGGSTWKADMPSRVKTKFLETTIIARRFQETS